MALKAAERCFERQQEGLKVLNAIDESRMNAVRSEEKMEEKTGVFKRLLFCLNQGRNNRDASGVQQHLFCCNELPNETAQDVALTFRQVQATNAVGSVCHEEICAAKDNWRKVRLHDSNDRMSNNRVVIFKPYHNRTTSVGKQLLFCFNQEQKHSESHRSRASLRFKCVGLG
eukprot:scaffold2526_cov131-Cylindrotheca_fusiformis.AAC.8